MKEGILVWKQGTKWCRSVRYGKYTAVRRGFENRRLAWHDANECLADLRYADVNRDS
jgi:hypothetical protein